MQISYALAFFVVGNKQTFHIRGKSFKVISQYSTAHRQRA